MKFGLIFFFWVFLMNFMDFILMNKG